MAQVTIKADSTVVELAKALLKFHKGNITEEEFISMATVLGYTPTRVKHGEKNTMFLEFAHDEAIRLLS